MKAVHISNFLRHSARAGIIAIGLGSLALAQQPGTTQGLEGDTRGASQFVPFNQFMANTSAMDFNSAATANVAGGGAFKVANTDAFAEMRQHITNLYHGVHVTHSFVQGTQTYDCIPEEQQPSVRMLGLKGIAAPPAPSDLQSASPPAVGATVLEESGRAAQSSLLPMTAVDRFGNATACEDHTVPIQRTTVEQMSRFPTLRAFLRKSPDGKGTPPVPPRPGAALTAKPAPPALGRHFHDYTYEYVYNLGGHSDLNVWDPGIATFWGEVFSLSQVWYAGFAAQGAVQTVEAGWQVFPDRLGDMIPHLFVYFTADGYNTSGCYDHSCSGFVQYSGRLFPGAALGFSRETQSQYEAETLWQWYAGNWWLKANGEWVGYYPGSLFGSGEMATHSSLIEYGGEILAGNGTSYDFNPEMGSGRFGTDGFALAAYQRKIWYFNALGASKFANLTPVNECPAGTSITKPYDAGPGWNEPIYDPAVGMEIFYFGGPGGYCP